MLPNIVLVGFMGCGKSSVGRRLAAMTGHRFVDTDELVTHAAGKSIPEIFAESGEEAFRRIESTALEDLVGVAGIILSTGGGAILSEPNRAALHKIGIVAWLDADPDILFERAMRSGKRPLLQTATPRGDFDLLLTARRPIYTETADVRIDSSHFDHDEAAHAVFDAALRFHHRGPAH